MSCPICCENFNLSSRKKIECPKCQGVFCSDCVKKYLLQDQGDICMQCHCEWKEDFLISNLTRKFMNTEYREQRRKKLIEKEIALLPEAMPLAENERKISILERRIRSVDKEINDLRILKGNYLEEISCYTVKQEKREIDIMGKCPKTACRGFIKRKSGECGICDTKVCVTCYEVLNEEEDKEEDDKEENEIKGGEAEVKLCKKGKHECKPENVETVKMLKKECRPCPKCGSQIFKIDGCDQMFCTQCKTAFSWDTGLIEKGRVHNPHYYEWLRTSSTGEIPREPEDNPCNAGELISYDLVRQMFAHKSVLKIHQNLSHIQEVVLPKLSEDFDNVQLRVDYLLKRITTKEFEFEIERRDKILRKRHVIYQCLEIYENVMIDIFNKYYQKYQQFYKENQLYKKPQHIYFLFNNQNLDLFFNEWYEILKFTNENLVNVSTKHKMKCDRYFIPDFPRTSKQEKDI